MVPIDQEFCIDVYEASRPDATYTDVGTDESMAVSKAGVQPWKLTDDSNNVADQACRAAGKRLCTEAEWQQACMGPEGTVYAYGDEYSATVCNGIDTYCYCDKESCQTADPCPFPHCYNSCRSNFHVEPTGIFEDCTNGYGIYDMNGNLWEHVLEGDDSRIRGGAYNCGNSELLHRCDYIPGDWSPDAKGFRCCTDGWTENDAGVETE
jgi:formylglycine-generating enzyme required for sulfatase activity